jgi:membrane protein DedA with SNARE-associated domain
MILAIAVGASLAADLSWYALGRWRGTQALKMLGRVSPIAGTLVHRVRHIFAAHRGAFQVGARFLPELNAIVAGLAGASKVSIIRFVCCGAVSALTWAGGWIGLGYLSSNVAAKSAAVLGVRLIVLFLAPFGLYLLLHRARRYQLIRLLRRGRWSAGEPGSALESDHRAVGRRSAEGNGVTASPSSGIWPAAGIGTSLLAAISTAERSAESSAGRPSVAGTTPSAPPAHRGPASLGIRPGL